MAIIMHPLTAKNDTPTYTADDYRHAINPLLVPSDGTAFNGLSGIRYGSPSPLVTVKGLTVTVKPHCGTISPWDGLGAYTYAITTNTTVQLADSTNNYKIAVTVEDRLSRTVRLHAANSKCSPLALLTRISTVW